MATHGRGRIRTRRDNEEGEPVDNQTALLATMTTLVNAMHVNIVATNQAMERMNGNNSRLGNHQAEGGPMTLTTFLKINPPIFKGSTNLTEANNWFQAMKRLLIRASLKNCVTSRGSVKAEGYEEWKCMKYQDDLRDDIMQAVVPLEVKGFAELVNKSRVVEECSRKTVMAREDRQDFCEEDQDKSLAPRGQDFKRSRYAL
ncbi:hypothetical protein AHAS_Ahas06G0175400 [Arachis hypogaea]